MSLVGMNPEVVKSVSREITREAQDLAASQRRIDGYVQQLARVWGGPDCQRFRRTWESQQRAQVRAATTTLTELGATLAREAEEQIQTSQAGATIQAGVMSEPVGPIGPLYPKPPAPPPGETWNDFSDELWGDLYFALDKAGRSDAEKVSDILQIQRIVENAPEPYKSLFLEHYKIFVYRNDGSGFYVAQWDEVHVDFADDGNDQRGPFATFFHEFGHGVDDKEKWFSWKSTTYKYNGASLHDTLVQDVHDNIHGMASHMLLNTGQVATAEQARHVTDAFMNRTGTNGLTAAEVTLYNRVQNNYSILLRSPDAEVASDIYNGVTGNALGGGYGHWDSNDDGVNDDHYWYGSSGDDWQDSQQKEFFAGYFGQQITQDPGLSITQNLFPSSSALVDQMALDMKG
ncbi:MAG: hypothetical protein LBK54_10925 [Propionibacteriaceae bacterium]|jgi:uncharacterized protein YukE|nr:hypothetical protein [Propionibacteriaceae bacterium]